MLRNQTLLKLITSIYQETQDSEKTSHKIGGDICHTHTHDTIVISRIYTELLRFNNIKKVNLMKTNKRPGQELYQKKKKR